MAPPRKPLAAARISGAMAKNPQRYRSRIEPIVTEPLGSPPEWLTSAEADAWTDFERRLPWLKRSHRCIVGIAAYLQARVAAGTAGVPAMQLLRLVLGQLGATPVDFHKVDWSPPPEGDDDPTDEFFR